MTMANPGPADTDRQLSLFDAPLPAAASPQPSFARPSIAPGAPGTSGKGTQGPAVPRQAGLRQGPARFHHPRAQRQVVLGEHAVGYEFRRARRRSIGFVVGLEGLSVSAPRWVAIAEVEAALQAKAGWILRKLHEQHERAQRLQAAKVVWQDGTTLPYLGETVIVLLDARVSGVRLHGDALALPGLPRQTLHVGLPHTASQDQIRDLVQSWLQRQARQVFEQRCAHFAPQLGVRISRLTLSSASTRWGSASASGAVRLNWRLIHFALPVIDYVVTHELAHLREMNHSPAFWEVVRSVLPDFEQSRGALRSEVLPAFD